MRGACRTHLGRSAGQSYSERSRPPARRWIQVQPAGGWLQSVSKQEIEEAVALGLARPDITPGELKEKNPASARSRVTSYVAAILRAIAPR